MKSTPSSREELLVRLIGIPSVTQSPEENDAALFIRDSLFRLAYFRANPSHLVLLPTPLEGDGRALHSVIARMMAPRPTAKTVVLVAHYDVVGVDAYGDLAACAFDPGRLASEMGKDDAFSAGVDEFLFGRGSMDMKCGLALEMELLRDYDADRELFDVNVVMVAVPDEENTGCGMRSAVKYLAALKKSERLVYIAAIDTEPSEPGSPGAKNELVFLGSMGKLLPTFYCKGLPAHAGNYYRGLSAALISSNVVCLAEASAKLVDPCDGNGHPSWMCIEQRTLSEGYSVTVPSRSVAYFNCFLTTRTPSAVLEEMKEIARGASARSLEHLRGSFAALRGKGYRAEAALAVEIKTLTFSDLFERAAAAFADGVLQFSLHMDAFAEGLAAGDIRDKGIAFLEELIRLSGVEAPFVAVGFLPPYNPRKSSLDGTPGGEIVLRASKRLVAEARERFGVILDREEYFAGISDLSFLGFSGTEADVKAITDNVPGWGTLFSVPIADMIEVDMPVMNLGPKGHDAHEKTERLEKRYSLEILPELLVFAIGALSEEWDEVMEVNAR